MEGTIIVDLTAPKQTDSRLVKILVQRSPISLYGAPDLSIMLGWWIKEKKEIWYLENPTKRANICLHFEIYETLHSLL
jgi:hypothetical protein